jgi:hypothetical protein
MKKTIIIVALALALAGCSNGYKTTNFPVVPPELEDCKFFELTNEAGARIQVARCPNSITATTYKAGKSSASTVVIDGTTYEKKEAP